MAHSIGSKWCIHAEGSIERPRYVRMKKWPRARRADIVVIDHDSYKKAVRDNLDLPPYEAMIEIKIILPGWGRRFYEEGVWRDIEKLEVSILGGITKNAFIVLLDAVSRRTKIPYFQEYLESITQKDSRLIIYHWPDSRTRIESIREAQFRRY